VSERLGGFTIHAAADAYPPIPDEQHRALVEDIRAHGQLVPAVVYQGAIVDGRHRIRACVELGITPVTCEWSGVGSLIDYVISLNLRRDMNASQRALVAVALEALKAIDAKARQVASLKRGEKSPVRALMPQRESRARDDAAAVHRVSPRYVQDAKRIQAEAPEKVERIRAGTLTITQAVREIKETAKEVRRDANRTKVAAVPHAAQLVGAAQFATIVIDPPWDFADEGDDDVYGRTRPAYAQMTEREIAELPVARLADDDCHLYLWITNRSLMTGKGWRLAEAWGFRPITILTWCKPSIGVGNYFRNNTEHLLFAVKGSQLLMRRDVGTWFAAPRGAQHSAKPAEAYSLIESCSPGPYLELFARGERAGWTLWGEDAAKQRA
jgi:N6-adenosine-specific RNA methylase IME4